MGWSYGHDNNDREIGYSVDAICDLDGCDTGIDRGLAYRCGALGAETGGNGPGCGNYFCQDHLVYSDHAWRGTRLCRDCDALAEDAAAHPECDYCDDGGGGHTCPECRIHPTLHDGGPCAVCAAKVPA